MRTISQSEADYPRTDPNAGSSSYYDSTFGKISRAVHAISSLPWMSDKITAEYFPGQPRRRKDSDEPAQPTGPQPREPWYVRRELMAPGLPPPMVMRPVSASIMLSPRPVYVSMSSAASSGSDSQSVGHGAPPVPPQMYMIPNDHGQSMASPFGAPTPVYYYTPPSVSHRGMSPPIAMPLPYPGTGFHPHGPPVIPMAPPPMSHHRSASMMSGHGASSSQLSPPQPTHYPRHARSVSGASASGVSWVG
jgi:hypothetical protein